MATIFLVSIHVWMRLMWRTVLATLAVFLLAFAAIALLPRHALSAWQLGVACGLLVVVAQVLILQRWVLRKPFRGTDGPLELRVERDGMPQAHPLAAGIGWALWWGMTWRSMALATVLSILLAIVLQALHIDLQDEGWGSSLIRGLGIPVQYLGIAWLLRWPYGETRCAIQRSAAAAAGSGADSGADPGADSGTAATPAS